MARSKADQAKGTKTGLTSRLAAEAKERQAADCTWCEALLGIIARKQRSIAETLYEIGCGGVVPQGMRRRLSCGLRQPSAAGPALPGSRTSMVMSSRFRIRRLRQGLLVFGVVLPNPRSPGS
ncbi:MAG: hypothetical protein MUF54_11060 [Polyangiaceae bacterium]|jgi:hypothetical protein|nr:hypothetical protein [Polyangiaceae bacterium]